MFDTCNKISFDLRDTRATFDVLDFEALILNFVESKKGDYINSYDHLYYIHIYDSNNRYMGAFEFSIILYTLNDRVHIGIVGDLRSDIIDLCKE